MNKNSDNSSPKRTVEFVTPVHDNNKKLMNQPLLERNTATSNKNCRPSRLKEYEMKYNNCKKTCVVNCNKTCYKDFINFENEEGKSMDPFDFSAKSVIIFITTLLITSTFLCSYRKFNNLIQINYAFNEYLFEFLFFNWRSQSILLFLMMYICVSNYFTKNIYIEERRNADDFNLNEEIHKIHMIKVSFSELITKDFLKVALINVISTFSFLVSTKVLPLGFCLIFNNSGAVVNFILFNTKKSLKKLMKFLLFLTVSFVLLIIFMNNGMNGLFTNETISTHYELGMLMCVFASCLSFFVHRNNINQMMGDFSPMTTILILNVNSVIVSSAMLFVFELLTTGTISIGIFAWVWNYESLMYVILIGLIGLLHTIFSLFSSIYLKPYFLKAIKLIEIPFSDFLAIVAFQLYNQPSDYIYYVVIFNFLITIGIVEFSKQ